MRTEYGSSLSCLRGIVRTEGVGGLYRAYWIHQATWAPFNGLYWLFYGRSTALLQGVGVEGTACFVGASTVAGVCASFVTSPLDLVKTRLQVRLLSFRFLSGRAPLGHGQASAHDPRLSGAVAAPSRLCRYAASPFTLPGRLHRGHVRLLVHRCRTPIRSSSSLMAC